MVHKNLDFDDFPMDDMDEDFIIPVDEDEELDDEEYEEYWGDDEDEDPEK